MTDLNTFDNLDKFRNDEMEEHLKIRNNLFGYFDLNEIKNFILNRIDESSVFSLVSQRSKKTIDPRNPVYNLLFNFENAKTKYNGNTHIGNFADIINWKANVFVDEIIDALVGEMTSIISESKKDPNYTHVLLKEPIKGSWSDDDVSHVNEIVPAIFFINTDSKEDSVFSAKMML
jgi:hypothetical protein